MPKSQKSRQATLCGLEVPGYVYIYIKDMFIWMFPFVRFRGSSIHTISSLVVSNDSVYFHPYLGKMNPFWLIFLKGLVQPPTSIITYIHIYTQNMNLSFRTTKNVFHSGLRSSTPISIGWNTYSTPPAERNAETRWINVCRNPLSPLWLPIWGLLWQLPGAGGCFMKFQKSMRLQDMPRSWTKKTRKHTIRIVHKWKFHENFQLLKS